MATEAEDESISVSPAAAFSAGDGGKARITTGARIAALTDGLHKILEKAVESPSHWQTLLDAPAKLWRYSGGNVALLMMQMAQRGTEEPTLAGYKEWARLGWTVSRGEHALWVIAPHTARVQQSALPDGTRQRIPVGEKLPPGTGDGEKKIAITGWRGQAVFDVSQTQGTPLLVPRGGAVAGVEADELWRALATVAGRHGFSVDVTSAQYGQTSGFTDFAGHRVQIGAWLSMEERTAVLAHELGHVLLHGLGDEIGRRYGRSADQQGPAEVEAESVAYTILRAHGIDRGPESAAYLAGWADAVIEAEKRQPTMSAPNYGVPCGHCQVSVWPRHRRQQGNHDIAHPPGFGGKISAASKPSVKPAASYMGGEGPVRSVDRTVMAGP
ncbi:ArdC-like ssDNA-binding domain-containing protein [Arthrobacter sp. Bz4]|uniref:ArdC-like ssDNA-binding domain-containing protein n=1 Tax=Arthrobacter sp. Bz4 TaxID=2171979 RepID=UPI0010575570|nr:ArdC-like ssDNA-binding domain-containing protein [Arthrobacter sp. Bz4]